MSSEKINVTEEAEPTPDFGAEIARLEMEAQRLQERYMNLDIMMDNYGWSEITGVGGVFGGPSREQVMVAAEQLRELTMINAHMKRGNLLRAKYVWNGGIHYEGIGGGRGRGNTNIQQYLDDAQNIREFFGPQARMMRSKARYTDGHAMWIGEDATKKLKMIPFERITGVLTNPVDISEIWALRIISYTNQNQKADPVLEARWIFLDEHVDKRQSNRIPVTNAGFEQIDMENRIFLFKANRTVGWTWGTPDALAAMGWVRMYREFMISGKKMSDAMAMLWAQVKAETKAGAQNAAVQVGGGKQGAGGVVVGGPEWAPLATAGKGYDFSSGNAILAAAATSLEVSTIALSSDVSAAGSSYGSAQTLDLPGRIAIAGIRDEEAEFDEQVLRWMGAKSPRAWFDSLQSAEDIYRLIQTDQFYWTNGLRSAQEQKEAMDTIKGKPTTLPVPDGVMLPNNLQFPDTLSNDAIPGGPGNAGQFAPPGASGSQAAAPGQGQGNGNGGAGNIGNIRKDTISK